jgi:hypothetical protein
MPMMDGKQCSKPREQMLPDNDMIWDDGFDDVTLPIKKEKA